MKTDRSETKCCAACGEEKPITNFKNTGYVRKDGTRKRGNKCRRCSGTNKRTMRTTKKRRSASLRARIRFLVSGARDRAKKRGLAFNLDASWVDKCAAQTVCEVTGSVFSLKTSGVRGQQNPLSPSLDRIIPQLGYVKGNVRVICDWANRAKNTLCDDDFIAMCRKVVSTADGQKVDHKSRAYA